MRKWFRDQQFRSLVKNSSYLAISRAVAAVGGLATLAFAGRGLGVAMFGMLVLIQSYVQAASGLTKFNSWQVVVRYGSPALECGDPDMFRKASGFAIGLDLSSGVVTMVGAILLLPFIGERFGLPAALLPFAAGYCLTLLTTGASAASGVLRVFDRFDLLSWQSTVQPNARALLSVAAWWAGAPFAAYLAIWLFTSVLSDLVMWWMAWRELHRRGMTQALRPTLSSHGLPGGWIFAINMNVTGSLSTAWGPLARLLVGAMLSPAAAGLFRVASSLADAAQRPTDFLNKVFYPQVMRLDPASKTPWKLMVRATLFASAIGLVMMLFMALFGEWLLRVAFGAQFVEAYGVLLVLLGAPLIAMISFPLPSMLYVTGRNSVPLVANIVGVAVYLAAIFPLIRHFELVGAGIGFLLGRTAMTLVMAVALASEHKRLRRTA